LPVSRAFGCARRRRQANCPVVVVIGFHWNRPLELSAMPDLVGKVRAQGGMLVEYAWVASALLFTWRQPRIVWVPPGRSRAVAGLPWTLLSMLLGWWSLMGLFWTIQALVQNLMGGVDVTAALIEPNQSPFAQAAAEDERKSRHTVALAFVGVLLVVLALAIVYLVLPYLKDLRRALSQ